MNLLCLLGELTPLSLLWPLFGHRIYFRDAYARCDRCQWRELLPVPDWLRREEMDQ